MFLSLITATLTSEISKRKRDLSEDYSFSHSFAGRNELSRSAKMGYNLYVTRRRNHFDENGPAITAEEWKSLVASDPELAFKDERVPLVATWSGESKWPEPWFDFCERYGSINTKNPDAPMIAKMLQIAKTLNAKVQGDDGETYTSPTESY